jgi:tetratricopeptide (TPR) repeat protein
VGQAVVQLLSLMMSIGLVVGMSMFTMFSVRRHRESQMQVEAAEELVQLRRWPEAAGVLGQILSQPMRSHALRFQALMYLTSVLARYHRFEDAIKVQNYMLETAKLDPTTERAIKLGRAMAMLRVDQLWDADRAIADLRRGDGRENSGGLALVEIYRDVKTGHPAEAIETFNQRREILRDQLGHRVGDAYALVARAHDLLEQKDDAQRAWTRATLLAPIEELARRYPEVASLVDRYVATLAPAKPQAGGVA